MNDIAKRPESTAIQKASEVEAVLTRVRLIQDLMRRAMVEGIDFGVIPGTNSKPTLLKPGAEKLAVMFKLAPKYSTTKTFHDNGHLTVECTCSILNLSGDFLGEASAMCSTMESKYRYRGGARLCPECGKPTIIKGKKEYGGGYLCFGKKGGCGAKFRDADHRITSQSEQKVENPDVADSYNTVLRIAEKRAFLGAIRLVTGSSALFDEEIPAVNERDEQPEHPPEHEHDDLDADEKKQWLDTLASKPDRELVNTKAIPEIEETRKRNPSLAKWKWNELLVYMRDEKKCIFNAERKAFVDQAEEEAPPF